MQSRMDKYQAKRDEDFKRSKKNTQLYEDVYDDIYRDTSYKNMSIIDSAKQIDIGKLKNILEDKYDTRQYRTLKNYSVEEDIEEKPSFMQTREKIYDINEIINDAKSKRAFIEEAKEKQKYTSFVERNKRYDNKYEQMQQEEKDLEDLINTMSIDKEEADTQEALDMFDLRGEEDTVVTNPISADFDTADIQTDVKEETFNTTKNIEKTLVKADKAFYTDSNMFTKNDFEDFSTLSRQLNKKGKTKKYIVIVLILLIILVLSYLVITNFIIKK